MIEGIGEGSLSVTGECLPAAPSLCDESTTLIGARLGRLDLRPSLPGFGFLKAAVDSLRFTEGVEADRGPWLGRAAAAPGVTLILASAGVESDMSAYVGDTASRLSDDGENTPVLDCGVIWADTAAAGSVLKSSGTGLIDRSGSEPGELVSSSICLGESLRTFDDSEVDGVGEASPPLLLILRFSFPVPFAVTDDEPFGRDSYTFVVFPLLARS